MKELPELFPHGRQLGKYQLIRRLAVGGMAEIYLARASGIEGFEKLVVLKRILPQHALDPQMLHMFLDEARLMATLTNPHITQVYDVGSQGDAPFFAMEYVHGANLREIMKAAAARADNGDRDGQSAERGDGPVPGAAAALIPLPHAIGILAAAAAGLHYAHDKLGPNGQPLNIVHRDVSPSNVLVTYDGSVKVSDFGIAKWSSQRSQTQEGALKGKFAYMSPEQCRGEPLDRRSDVFALGTLLYELTTGAPPFGGGSDYDILTQIVNAEAPAPALPDGSYPAELARIVRRALARAPADRYPTAQGLQLDLETFAREQRLVLSTVGLAQYMSALFAEPLARWQEAQRSGKSLEQHLAGAESQALRAARATPTTATDAFAQAPAAPRRARRRGAGAVTAVLALVVAGGLAAALKLQRDSRHAGARVEGRAEGGVEDRAEDRVGGRAEDRAAAPTRAARDADGLSTATRAANIVESHSASSLDRAGNPRALPPSHDGLRRAELTPARGPSSPGLNIAARDRRAARPAAAAAPAPHGGAVSETAAPAIKDWDPDSPIPP
jgi:serine/threonine protein kinase